MSDSDEHPEPELGPEIEILPWWRNNLVLSQFIEYLNRTNHGIGEAFVQQFDTIAKLSIDNLWIYFENSLTSKMWWSIWY